MVSPTQNFYSTSSFSTTAASSISTSSAEKDVRDSSDKPVVTDQLCETKNAENIKLYVDNEPTHSWYHKSLINREEVKRKLQRCLNTHADAVFLAHPYLQAGCIVSIFKKGFSEPVNAIVKPVQLVKSIFWRVKQSEDEGVTCNFGSIDEVAYQTFISLGINPDKCLPVINLDWFHGKLSREEAEKKMKEIEIKDKNQYLYFCRLSSQFGYAITLYLPWLNKFEHHVVRPSFRVFPSFITTINAEVIWNFKFKNDNYLFHDFAKIPELLSTLDCLVGHQGIPVPTQTVTNSSSSCSSWVASKEQIEQYHQYNSLNSTNMLKPHESVVPPDLFAQSTFESINLFLKNEPLDNWYHKSIKNSVEVLQTVQKYVSSSNPEGLFLAYPSLPDGCTVSLIRKSGKEIVNAIVKPIHFGNKPYPVWRITHSDNKNTNVDFANISEVAVKAMGIDISKNLPVVNLNWFHGTLSREEAEKKMKELKGITPNNYYYLCRLGSQFGYALTFYLPWTNQFIHYIVTPAFRSGSLGIMWELKFQECSLHFDSFEKIIEYFSSYDLVKEHKGIPVRAQAATE